jgi:signal transduction histidine kinase
VTHPIKESGLLNVLRPQELEAAYAISRAIAQPVSIDVALDQVVHLTRNVFIFDNMVLYLPQETDLLDPAYARVIGRGRSAEADLAWGEGVALEAYRTNSTTVHQEKLDGWEAERLNWRDFLGLPLHSGESLLGVLVFGRFGGPPYMPEQVHLAEFISSHISQLLERQNLIERIASLEAEKRLRRLQDDFIATVSHELCTPLGFIKGYATTLLRQDTDWDEASRREFLTIIDEEADRLRELIDDLLDSSRLQAGTLRMQLKTVNLEQLLEEVALRAISRYKGLVVQLQLKPDIVIQADSMRLVQLFDNLLSNAVKYASGSPVFVTVEMLDGRVHIEVQDRGPGIGPEHLPHLFERFYRVPGAQSQAHGTGLGLFICREIVLAHGGEMRVESEKGKGTTFHICLPAGSVKCRGESVTRSQGEESTRPEVP